MFFAKLLGDKLAITAMLLLLLLHPGTNAQDSTVKLPLEYLAAITQKTDALSSKLDTKTQKVLASFQKIEAKLWRRLSRKDSTKATALKQHSAARYKTLQQTLSGATIYAPYNAALDTLKTSLDFLAAAKGTWQAENKAALSKASASLKELDRSLASTEAVKAYLKERRQALKQSVGKLVPKEMRKLNKQAYYYSQQVAQYKETLKDKKKIERKALDLLTGTKAYKDFFRKNSELAKLFRLPGGDGESTGAISLQGLQTRASVSQAITQRFGSSPEVITRLRDQASGAQGQLASLKSKVEQLTAGSFGNGEAELPEGFKPNSQKTKPFLKRLEYGANIQNQKGTSFLPVTSDLGLSLGYKLNDKGAFGIGGSYKLGWGKGFRDLELSSQGVGIRSYLDYKIKGAFFIAGGYEMNYRSAFHSLAQLQAYSAWQRSGLLGVSKKYKAGKKLKGNIQVLWDFLSYQQVPRTQAIIFRIGYSFK
ncbi:MAG: hypothetical protein JWP69_1707 [Flaviaesturariibacter sp.]|nr:hypothetical protein [Flaviaesturariibacter sp.]